MILPDTACITDADLEQAATLIREAEKPMIFVGGGAIAADASAELLEFAEKVHAPVCDSMMGERLHGADFTGSRAIPGGNGASFPQIYRGALRQDHVDVHSSLHHQFML